MEKMQVDLKFNYPEKYDKFVICLYIPLKSCLLLSSENMVSSLCFDKPCYKILWFHLIFDIYHPCMRTWELWLSSSRKELEENPFVFLKR